MRMKNIDIKVPVLIDGKVKHRRVRFDIRELQGELHKGADGKDVLVITGKIRVDQPLIARDLRFFAPGDEPVGSGQMAILRRFEFGVTQTGNRAGANSAVTFASAETNTEHHVPRPENFTLDNWLIALCLVAGVKSPTELGGQNVRLHFTDGRVRFIQSCTDPNVWVSIHGQGRSG